jgi:P pilus assembly chaperone PapD
MLKNFWLFFALLMFGHCVAYSNYTISPIKIVFKRNTRVESITFSNNVNELRHFQISLFKVEYDGIAEKLVPSKDLLVTPVMFDLDTSHTQIIRVAQKKDGEPLTGKYKLSIRELPRYKPKDYHHIHLAAELIIPITFEE